jgi:hypothetical protein
MSAVLIPHPAAGLRRAREVVQHPDFHTEGAVLEACEHLVAWGDWMDVERAHKLRKAIVRGAVAEINRRGRRRRLILHAALLLSLLAALAVLIGQVAR